MSLPTTAHFYLESDLGDDVLVNSCFVNCGWWYDERETKREIIEFLNKEDKFQWDYVKVYGKHFTKGNDFTGKHPYYYYDENAVLRNECKKQEGKTYIDRFKGQYDWLSNFYPVNVEYDGEDYPSVEHAYMSAKSDDMKWKMFCMNHENSAGEVKKKSREVELVEGWDTIKNEVMRKCLESKFNQEPFRQKLLDTGDFIIREGNWWNDTYWGICLKKQYGQNMLGNLIMSIRSNLALDVVAKKYKIKVPKSLDIENVRRDFTQKLSDLFSGVQPMDSSAAQIMEIKYNMKTIKVTEQITRTSYIEYDEEGLALNHKLTDEEILSDVKASIDELGLNKCVSQINQTVDSVTLDGVDINDIQSVRITSKTGE